MAIELSYLYWVKLDLDLLEIMEVIARIICGAETSTNKKLFTLGKIDRFALIELKVTH